jgi:hypothetical protein
MKKYITILIILFIGVLFVFLGAKCPWEKEEETGSSYTPWPKPVYGTWAWDGTDWQLMKPDNESPARGEHAMVYDSARQRLVLFGGGGNNIDYDDTWEWDGTSWIQCYSTVTPSARSVHAMAYDSARQRTILFGGKDLGGGQVGKRMILGSGMGRIGNRYFLLPAP